MTYKRKTKDEWQVLQNWGYGHGWELATCAETFKEGKSLLRDYRENQPECPVKLVCKRVPL